MHNPGYTLALLMMTLACGLARTQPALESDLETADPAGCTPSLPFYAYAASGGDRIALAPPAAPGYFATFGLRYLDLPRAVLLEGGGIYQFDAELGMIKRRSSRACSAAARNTYRPIRAAC